MHTVPDAPPGGSVGDADAPGVRPVVGRALRLLEAFSAERPTLTLSAMARRLGMPLSTVHRLAADLLAWGALERDADGRYRIGLRLWEIASLAPRGAGLRERALPHLEDLAHATRETVQLGVLDGDEVMWIERIGGSGATRVLTRVGGRFPLTASAAGLTLLAHAPRDLQERVLSRPLPRFTPWTLTDPAAVRDALDHARAHGWVAAARQVTDDAVAVAAPVRDRAGAVVAAVSVVAAFDVHSPRHLAPLLVAGARAISRDVVSDPD